MSISKLSKYQKYQNIKISKKCQNCQNLCRNCQLVKSVKVSNTVHCVLFLRLDLDLNVAGQDCHFLDLLGSLSMLLLKDGHSLVQALNVTIDVVEPVLSRPELVNYGLSQLIPEISNSLGIGGDSRLKVCFGLFSRLLPVSIHSVDPLGLDVDGFLEVHNPCDVVLALLGLLVIYQQDP